MNDFKHAVQHRRTYYGISKEVHVESEEIKKMVEHAVSYTPSPFNSQSSRVIILMNESHNALWDLTWKALEKIVSGEQAQKTKDRIQSFKNGVGTILYFEDQEVVKGLEEKFESYKHNFQTWSQQSSGMLQFVIWTALELEGLGASLQHYNELIESDVKEKWNIPESWKLIAQMPFGKPTFEPGEKEINDIDKRVLMIK
jgi:predicted oxidoreductase (fatty acid repression mutant protein)